LSTNFFPQEKKAAIPRKDCARTPGQIVARKLKLQVSKGDELWVFAFAQKNGGQIKPKKKEILNNLKTLL